VEVDERDRRPAVLRILATAEDVVANGERNVAAQIEPLGVGLRRRRFARKARWLGLQQDAGILRLPEDTRGERGGGRVADEDLPRDGRSLHRDDLRGGGAGDD